MSEIESIQQLLSEKGPAVMGLGPKIRYALLWESNLSWQGNELVTDAPWVFETTWVHAGDHLARARMVLSHFRGRLSGGHEKYRRYEMSVAFAARDVKSIETVPTPSDLRAYDHPDITYAVGIRINFNHSIEIERWNGPVLDYKEDRYRLDQPYFLFWVCSADVGQKVKALLEAWVASAQENATSQAGRRIESGGAISGRSIDDEPFEAPGSTVKY